MRLNATRLGSIASSRSFGDQIYDLAGQVPTLDLNFAGTKTLDPRISFTRASSGTYVGSDGLIKTATTNEARFDHNPTTGESLGLLVEEPRTNLQQRSEEFNDAVWTLFGTASRTANTTVAPDGATTADSVTLPTSSGIFQIINGSANTTYTFSVWIRCNTTQSVRLVINTNLSDPTTLTVTATSSWQRFSITKTTSAGTLTVTSQVDTGGGNTFFLWGAQLETGAFPTSYIPTTGATATRAADVVQITGAAFSSFYNQSQGTLYSQSSTTRQIAIGATGIAQFNDGASSAIRIFSRGSGATGSVVTNIGVTQFDASPTGVLAASSVASIALAYAVNNCGSAGNGGTPSQSGSATIPTVNQLVLGSDAVYLNGTIKRFTYWPTRLANVTLQSISQL
jgi:hypothetical protein